MLTIENKSRRTVILNLPHDVVCTGDSCGCGRMKVGVQDHDPQTGERTLRAIRKKVPASITLTSVGTPGATLTGLPNRLIHVAELKRAVARGALVVTREAPPSPPAAEAPIEQRRTKPKPSTEGKE
jgi:hypothetical protein